MPTPRIFLLFSIVCTLSLAAVSCSSTLRAATYGPSFRYVDRADLRSAMWRLAKNVRALDTVLNEPELAADERQTAVVSYLEDIQQTALGLRGSGEASNHPLLDDHLDELIDDVRRAREAAAATPPSYAPAGEVTQSCLRCHAHR